MDWGGLLKKRVFLALALRAKTRAERIVYLLNAEGIRLTVSK